MAERDIEPQRLVFVSWDARDNVESAEAFALLRSMLSEDGYEVVDGPPDVLPRAGGAVVIVSPRTLSSAVVAEQVGALTKRLSSEPAFRLVALPTMSLDVSSIADSPLTALSGHDVPPGPSLEWRVQQVLWRLRGGPGRAAKGAPDKGASVVLEHGPEVFAVAAGSPGGVPLIVSGGADGSLAVWRLDAAERWASERIPAHGASVRAVAIALLGGAPVSVSAGDEGRIQLVSLARDEPFKNLPLSKPLTGHDGRIRALAIAELDGRPTIVSGGDDGTLRLWDLGEGTARGEPLRGHDGAVRALVVAELAGRAIAVSAGSDGTLRTWDLLGGSTLGKPQHGHRGGVLALAVGDRDGDAVVVSGGADGSLRLWEISSGGDLENWDSVHSGEDVFAVAIGATRHGPVVVSGGVDTAIYVSDLQDGSAREILRGHERRVEGLATFTSGGRLHAVSASADGTLRVWDLEGAATRAGAVDTPDERTEWIPDAPAPEDLLERRALVSQLATRLQRLREEEAGESFLIHIDGPWGSGKSTLLRFLEEELGDRWLVVRFDAWRQMRVGPPWWALLASLRRALTDDRKGRFARAWLRMAEAWQRAPRLVLVSAVMVVALLVGLFVLFGLDLGGAEEAAGSLAVLVATATALLGAATAMSRFWLWESAAGARVYEQSHRDPMESLADHFGWLIARAGKPVVFFVDDLDRCGSEYVVDLLDSVQTLVRDAAARPGAGGRPGRRGRRSDTGGAYVVVSADGRWIRNSYEQMHERSSGAVGEPGRPLGYLFLDKIFQLTFEVPALSRERQGEYLRRLLRTVPDDDDDDGGSRAKLARERVDVARRLAGSTTDSQAVAVHQSASAPVRAALASELVEKLAEPQLERATEHALRKFAVLLEPNPRAMKRFVNAFGLARALQIVQDAAVPRDELALWTILRSRWPALADCVRANPDVIEALVAGRAPADDAVPKSLAPLFVSDDVARVVTFKHGGPLTVAAIRACCGVFDDEDAGERSPPVA